MANYGDNPFGVSAKMDAETIRTDLRQLLFEIPPIRPECIKGYGTLADGWIFFTSTQEGAAFADFKKYVEAHLSGKSYFKTVSK